jgi:hypothetical protein
MKQKESMANTVFDALYATISIPEDIHRNVAGIKIKTAPGTGKTTETSLKRSNRFAIKMKV